MEISVIPLGLLRRAGLTADCAAHAAVFLSTLLVIALLPLASLLPHVCLLQYLCGMPCPGCGILTSMRAIVTANFAAAWKANPASLAIAGVFGFQLLAQPVAVVWNRSREIVSRTSRYMSSAATAALFAVWVVRLISKGN